MISVGGIVCDIGTDHGYIPIYAVSEGICEYAYACDVNQGPLNIATENIKEYGLSHKIFCVLSDGLENLKDSLKYDSSKLSIVIAGMGGLLINRILGDGMELAKSAHELILSPHSEIMEVRRFLLENGFVIADENMVFEDGKFYTVIKALPKAYFETEATNGSDPEDSILNSAKMNAFDLYAEYSELELMFGAKLLEKKHPVLCQYLDKELDTSGKIMKNLEANAKEASMGRKAEIAQRVEKLLEAKKYFGEE